MNEELEKLKRDYYDLIANTSLSVHTAYNIVVGAIDQVGNMVATERARADAAEADARECRRLLELRNRDPLYHKWSQEDFNSFIAMLDRARKEQEAK